MHVEDTLLFKEERPLLTFLPKQPFFSSQRIFQGQVELFYLGPWDRAFVIPFMLESRFVLPTYLGGKLVWPTS